MTHIPPSILICAGCLLIAAVCSAIVRWDSKRRRVCVGLVIFKRFEPAHESEKPEDIPEGKNFLTAPSKYYVPDRWLVTIIGVDKKGRRGASEWPVPHERYDKIAFGDLLNFDSARTTQPFSRQ